MKDFYEKLGDLVEILDDFVVETYELIDQLNQDILRLEERPDDDVINRVFRAFHTIKGTSGFLSFDAAMELAHSAENLLNKIRSGELQITESGIDILLQTVDWFKMFIADVENRRKPAGNIQSLQQQIEAVAAANMIASSGPPASPEPPPEVMMTQAIAENIPQELIDEFLSETGEFLDTVGNDIMSLEIEPDNQDIINAVFRVFHTIKGNAALMGLDQMAAVAHKSEDIMSMIRNGKLNPEQMVVDALLKATDFLKTVLEDIRNTDYQVHDVSGLFIDLSTLLDEPEAADSLKGEADTDVSDNPSEKEEGQTTGSRYLQNIRVSVARLDKLMNYVGELIVESNHLQQVSEHLKQTLTGQQDRELLEKTGHAIAYLSRDIYDSVMTMRMLPIASIFSKFPRIVRDLAKEQGRLINLVIFGEDTELDRSVIEAVRDPMVHLLRNAIDHGIEPPEVRESQGKPEKGTISLAVFQSGNQVVISMKDDGRGIDPQQILAKALEKQIISTEEATLLAPDEILKLLFRPGFSTAAAVSSVSGRGVGLDVVSTNIARINGNIEIKSVVGYGTEFLLRLPLTLTSMAGMVVQIATETYIIPLAAISETVRLQAEDIVSDDTGEHFNYRDQVIPALYLDKFLDVPAEPVRNTRSYFIIVMHGGNLMALGVPAILGKEEVVVKPLGQFLNKVRFFLGASIRGDGRIALVLDIACIMEQDLENRGVAA